ncbi:methylglyoxal synthase [Acidovorax facilis]|uniref:methylglyoxal synthase n=1 Tax=Acidovorax facilis TaxID=12917 RepID=UPI003D652E4D
MDRDGGLARWLITSEHTLRQLSMQLEIVGGAFKALETLHLLESYEGAHALPYGREGGLMRLTSRIAGGLESAAELDGIISLIDPLDPSSLYPEAQALKRQCVIHGKPFVGTVAGAVEWLEVEAYEAGHIERLGGAGSLAKPIDQTGIALIAHDALKTTMVEYASRHFCLLSLAKHRVGTGTTSRLLNEMAWTKGWPRDQDWVQPFRSGPLGGDAQIAELILDGLCQKVIFFEDVHVARQHEADIQLLERAVYTATYSTSCINTVAMADAWARAWSSALS